MSKSDIVVEDKNNESIVVKSNMILSTVGAVSMSKCGVGIGEAVY